MLKDILKKLGVEPEDKSDEELEKLINEQIDAKDEHITTLEEEKDSLSKSNQELSASVEGLKADKEKLDKDLSVTKGQLDQITGLYKENFTKPVETQESDKKVAKLTNDVLQLIYESN